MDAPFGSPRPRPRRTSHQPLPPDRIPGIGEAASWAWARFKANAWSFLVPLGLLVVLAVAALFAFVSYYVSQELSRETSTRPAEPTLISDPEPAFLPTFLIGLVIGFVVWLLTVRLVQLALRVVDGHRVTVGYAFSAPLPAGAPAFVLMLTALFSGLGAVSFNLPLMGELVLTVVYVAIGIVAQAAMFPLIEHDLRPLEALSDGFNIVRAEPVFFLVAYLLSMVGVIACGIGILVTVPWSLLMFAYGYDRITRHPQTP